MRETELDMPLGEMMSTRTEPLEYVDVFGKVWQEFPGWKPGDPWQDRWIMPEDEGYATLGWQVIEWLQTYVQSPNGDGPCRLTPEQQRFILHWYSFDPETEMPRYRSGVFMRPKGAGKDPIAAMLCITEFVGPCRLGGWDADGNPIAVAHPNPLVQLAAVSKEQNTNTVSLFPVMMDQEFQDMFDVSIGVEVSYAQKRRCTLKALTSNFRTQEGARPSFVAENEALALDTPIPTPSGWTTMGELQDGDTVYAVDGTPTRVTKAHPVQEGRRCFRVTFDDGTSVVASDGHKWPVKHSAAKEFRRKTTLEMFESKSKRHQLPPREAIESPEADLPVDPYVLGLWLGDGSAQSGVIACHEDDLHETLGLIWRAGYTSAIQSGPNHIRVAGGRVKGRTGTSLQSQLRLLGVLRNKHIPSAYMRGSFDQRLALLQGLMDSDGSIRRTGETRFTGTLEPLVEGVFELAKSLGINARLPTWQVRDAERWPDRAHWKPCGFINMQVDESIPVFRAKRKAALLREAGKRRTSRAIVGIEEVESVPVRCLTVAHDEHLFLCGEGMYPTSNTHHWLESQGGTDFHAVLGRNLTKRGHADPFARRLMITNAYKPSEESVARNIREGIEDALAGRYVDTGTLMYDSVEVRADVPIRPPAEHCSDVDDEGNPRPTLEDRIQWLMRLLREVRGDAFWLNLRQTAEEILSPENQHALSDMRRFYLNQVTAADEAWLDRKDIIAAIDPEVAERRRSADSGMDSFEVGWLRVDPDEPIVMFFDGSKSDDATGLVGCRVSDGYTFTLGVWQRPTNLPDDEKARWRVDRSAVDRRVDQVFRRFNVVAFWGDPSHAKDEVDYTPYWDALMDEWHRKYSDQLQVWAVNSQQSGVHAIMWDMVAPARTAQFVAAAQKTVEDFESLDITIDGHPALVKHLTNAQEREDEKNGITLGKESRYSPRKIDLAVCLVGARMLRRVVKLAGLDNDKAASWFAG